MSEKKSKEQTLKDEELTSDNKRRLTKTGSLPDVKISYQGTTARHTHAHLHRRTHACTLICLHAWRADNVNAAIDSSQENGENGRKDTSGAPVRIQQRCACPHGRKLTCVWCCISL
jgi:hypothetical protein